MCSTIKSGTKAYMGLYPEESTDGVLRLGNIVPDFAMDTTQGKFDSFHEWKKGKWAILFGHPADFTPVCTTEIGRLALKYDKLSEMGCLVATLSVDPVKSHEEWLEDVVAHCENKIEIKFPIIGDQDRSISIAYGMIDPGNLDEQKLPPSPERCSSSIPRTSSCSASTTPRAWGGTWTRSYGASRPCSSVMRSPLP